MLLAKYCRRKREVLRSAVVARYFCYILFDAFGNWDKKAKTQTFEFLVTLAEYQGMSSLSLGHGALKGVQEARHLHIHKSKLDALIVYTDLQIL